ncbi:nucleotidyltransferase domain-containing protein [Candidatus Woesearchaeota archaeon]|nr:nucleotidyltransferase domain-containing protein [Candidatus Woesearchaeota archaeon]
MRFDIKKKENIAKRHYVPGDLDIAYKFSEAIYKECGDLIKGIILFGATARKEKHPHGDIDILIVLDDTSIFLTREVLETYRIITTRKVNEISRRIHVTTLKFTSFWEYMKAGDPVGVNILRDGVALVDTGFFDPLQHLLYQGRIRPTAESVYVYFSRAPQTLANSKWHILQATLDLYWAVIDASHAALMSVGEIPPSPDHVADLLQTALVQKKLLEPEHVSTMRLFYKLSKMIVHREIKDIAPKEYENYYKSAEDFVKRMQKIIERKVGKK